MNSTINSMKPILAIRFSTFLCIVSLVLCIFINNTPAHSGEHSARADRVLNKEERILSYDLISTLGDRVRLTFDFDEDEDPEEEWFVNNIDIVLSSAKRAQHMVCKFPTTGSEYVLVTFQHSNDQLEYIKVEADHPPAGGDGHTHQNYVVQSEAGYGIVFELDWLGDEIISTKVYPKEYPFA